MRRLIVIAIILLSCANLAFAAPVTIMDPGGQSQAKVRDGLIGAPNGFESAFGSHIFRVGKCRVLSVSFHSSTIADIVGIYNTSGNYLITDLEFEFDIGISANTSIKTDETIDCKGALFEKGLGVLAGNPSILSTAIFDY